MSILEALGDRWVFDLAAFVILAGLGRTEWNLTKREKAIERQVTAVEQRLEAAAREQEGDLW